MPQRHYWTFRGTTPTHRMRLRKETFLYVTDKQLAITGSTGIWTFCKLSAGLIPVLIHSY